MEIKNYSTLLYATFVCILMLTGCGSETVGQSSVWTATTIEGAPEARSDHTAVWTGTEMIVWGGLNDSSITVNTGGRFNPLTNTWASMSIDGAPQARYFHSAIWTGTEMIVWGGYSGSPDFDTLDTGARYNPQTDTWSPVSNVSAPTARMLFPLLWTGTEMIVWGGDVTLGIATDSGALYNPATDSWLPIQTVNAPSARKEHTAVWTGSEMILWGGVDSNSVEGIFNTGGIYDPITDTWTTTELVNAPLARHRHVSVWTGSEMIIFGGIGSSPTATFSEGSLYDPVLDTWTSMSVDGAPEFLGFRFSKPAVWSGDQLIAWFQLRNAARYSPSTDTWSQITSTGAPSSRTEHSTVWTGSRMIVWGGTGTFASVINTGGIYNPEVDLTPLQLNQFL